MTEMKHSSSLKKTVAGIMTVVFGFLCLFAAPAQAALVGTADILQVGSEDPAHPQGTLDRDRRHISQKLQSWGVDPAEAEARVNAMTDGEVTLLAGKIDQMPAGAGLLEFLAIMALLGFITLVITDIIGVTDVFTFVKKQ
jgi:hypothetical protein